VGAALSNRPDAKIAKPGVEALVVVAPDRDDENDRTLIVDEVDDRRIGLGTREESEDEALIRIAVAAAEFRPPAVGVKQPVPAGPATLGRELFPKPVISLALATA
jgi:hypothetical protein